MKKIISIFLALSLLLMVPVLPSHAESQSNETCSSKSSTETLSSVQSNEGEETHEPNNRNEDVPEEKQDGPVSSADAPSVSDEEDRSEKEEDPVLSSADKNEASSEEVEASKKNTSSEDSSSVSSENSAENEESMIDPQNEAIETQTTRSFSTTQNVSGSVYDEAKLTVSKISQTNDTVNLSMVFEGAPTIDEGDVYITFKFPEEIDISKSDVSASYDIRETYRALILIPIPKNERDNYQSDEIFINDNTIHVNYKITDDSSSLGILYRKAEANHKFTLNITLKNEAFSEEGTKDYTFQTTGTQDENSAFNETKGVQAVTLPLTITETGKLTLNSVPNLNFQTTRIGETDYVSLDPAGNHEIVIEDTRIFSKDWTLTVQSKDPLATSGSTSAPLRMGALDADGNFSSFENGMKIADSKESTGLINLNELNQKIVVTADHSHVLSDTYSTTVDWVLTDVVQ